MGSEVNYRYHLKNRYPNADLCFHHYVDSKTKLQQGKYTLESCRHCEGRGLARKVMFLLQGFLWSTTDPLPPALLSPPAPKWPSGRNIASCQALLSRMGLAKDCCKSTLKQCLHLRWLKRYCPKLVMGFILWGQQKPEPEKYKACLLYDLDAYCNIVFHSLDIVGPYYFQFLLSLCPSKKWLFFLLLGLLGHWKGFCYCHWVQWPDCHSEPHFSLKLWMIPGSHFGFNAGGLLEMGDGHNL